MNKSYKKIGIVGWSTGESSFGVTKPYLQYLSSFGQVEILTPSKYIREDLDLIVLPGGQDVSSSVYGEVPGFMNSNPDLYKEYFFLNNLEQYIEAGKSIFGICLGMQQLAVYFGSGLTQHLPALGIHGYYSDPREELVHSVHVHLPEDDVKFTQKVNSMHHQGVLLQDLSKSLTPLAIQKAKNVETGMSVVEALMHKDFPIAGVQWHPEHIYDKLTNLLITKLLKNEYNNSENRQKQGIANTECIVG
jgi:putative glutamine amidotransferase